MFEVGKVIAGKYRIDRDVGQGGMGTVVSATHLQLGTEVALKYLKGNVASDATTVARFMREARAAAQLRSEHICRVLDVAEEQGSPYIVMEMLEGTDLNKLSKTGPVDPGSAVEFVRQACSGLAEAHARGIVHRDLKPANLFLTYRADGSVLVKVLDFGVAKAPDMPGATAGPRLTESVHLVGSPAYMSPEQIASSRDVDARTDVWSLGVILFRLIGGHLPFDGDNMAILAMQIIDAPMPALPNASPALSAIVERCLVKDPADRIQTVTELAQLLRPFAGVASVRETHIDVVPVAAAAAALDDIAGATVNHRGLPHRPSAMPKAPPVATLRLHPAGKSPAPVQTPLSSRITAQVEPAVTPFVAISHLVETSAPSMSTALTAQSGAAFAPPVALAAASESPAPLAHPAAARRARGLIGPALAIAAIVCVFGVWKIMAASETAAPTAAAPAPAVPTSSAGAATPTAAAPTVILPDPAPVANGTDAAPLVSAPSPADDPVAAGATPASTTPASTTPASATPASADLTAQAAPPKTRTKTVPAKSQPKAKTAPVKAAPQVDTGAKAAPKTKSESDFGASRI